MAEDSAAAIIGKGLLIGMAALTGAAIIKAAAEAEERAVRSAPRVRTTRIAYREEATRAPVKRTVIRRDFGSITLTAENYRHELVETEIEVSEITSARWYPYLEEVAVWTRGYGYYSGKIGSYDKYKLQQAGLL